jgi:hypothetical protein
LRPGRLILSATLLANIGSTPGCTPDFDDVTTVKDLRVLAMSADIPEILFEGGPLSMQENLCLDGPTLLALASELNERFPEHLPPVTLRPLVVDPRGGGRPVHYRAVVCLSPTGNLNPMEGGMGMAPSGVRNTAGRGECPADAPVLAEGDAVPPDGTPVVPIVLRMTPTREQVMAALRADVLGMVYGLPLTVQLTVSAGSERVVARKRVLIGTRLNPGHRNNENPVIEKVVHRLSEHAPEVPFDVADPFFAPVPVPLGGSLKIEPARREQDRETYPTRVGDRRTGCVSITTAVEAQRFAFFATAGTFGPPGTNSEPPIIRDEPTDPSQRLASTYRAPRALLPGESELVRIYIVTRDERVGSSFIELALRLIP